MRSRSAMDMWLAVTWPAIMLVGVSDQSAKFARRVKFTVPCCAPARVAPVRLIAVGLTSTLVCRLRQRLPAIWKLSAASWPVIRGFFSGPRTCPLKFAEPAMSRFCKGDGEPPPGATWPAGARIPPSMAATKLANSRRSLLCAAMFNAERLPRAPENEKSAEAVRMEECANKAVDRAPS